MIRQLNPHEVPLMIRGGQEFFAEGEMPGGFKPDVFVKRWKDLIETGVGVVFGMFGVNGLIQGALGAVTCPDPFNGDKMAIESFWYVRKEFRGRGGFLLKEFERWARENGCKRMCMIHLQKLQPEELKVFYERMGYNHIESNYVKSLCN